jgi:hypothetical protein
MLDQWWPRVDEQFELYELPDQWWPDEPSVFWAKNIAWPSESADPLGDIHSLIEEMKGISRTSDGAIGDGAHLSGGSYHGPDSDPTVREVYATDLGLRGLDGRGTLFYLDKKTGKLKPLGGDRT